MVKFEVVIDFSFDEGKIILVLPNQIYYFDSVFFPGLYMDA